jgi:hypothetical protein
LSFPFVQLAYAYSSRDATEKLQRTLEYALRLSPNPALRAALMELQVRPSRPSITDDPPVN